MKMAKAEEIGSFQMSKLFTASNRNLSFSVIVLFLILITLKFFNESIIQFCYKKIFENDDSKMQEHLEINEITINKYMTFQKVKMHLFYKEDSHFKLKYGSDFDPDYYDMILIKHEVLEILKKDSDPVLKKIIIENIKNLNEIRVVLLINLISILLLFAFFICTCLLLNAIQLELGLLKSLIFLIAILFILLVMVICFKLITKIEKSKGEFDNNKKNFENAGLVVLDRQVMK